MSTEKKKSTPREFAEALIIALILALVIRTFVIQAFKIPSGSMLPTLQIGDHLLVSKCLYGIKMPFTGSMLLPFKAVKRQDIIVFRYPRDRSVDYIKRVIALPGDTVAIRNKQVFVNGKPIDDGHAHFTDRIISDKPPKDNLAPVTLPEHKYFVMGDNRDNSNDSRFWGFVDEKDILGKALIIYWSWDLSAPLFSLERLSSVRWGRLAEIVH